MSLELKVSADDVKSLFTKDRKLLMAALRHKDPSIGGKYSPNLCTTPLGEATNFTFRAVSEYLEATVGFNRSLLQSSVTAAADTWRGLVASLDIEKQASGLDELIEQYVSQLKWFEGLYRQLSSIKTAELPNDTANSFEHGIVGLRELIIRSNMMYSPRTRAKFLQHVHEGVVEEKYEQRLLRGSGWFAQLGEAVGSAMAKASAYFRYGSKR